MSKFSSEFVPWKLSDLQNQSLYFTKQTENFQFHHVQGVSFRNGLYELALTDIDMQVRFGLKMVLECWDREFLGTTTIFQKSNISWPQQPPTERVPDISEKLDFWWSIPWKGASIGHIGARDDLTIRISNFFDEMRLLRSSRPLRLLRLLRSLRLLRL